MTGLTNILLVLDEISKTFAQLSTTHFERANKEHNIRLKRDDLIAANVWAKAAAHVEGLKTNLATDWANEQIRNEILRYHKEED